MFGARPFLSDDPRFQEGLATLRRMWPTTFVFLPVGVVREIVGIAALELEATAKAIIAEHGYHLFTTAETLERIDREIFREEARISTYKVKLITKLNDEEIIEVPDFRKDVIRAFRNSASALDVLVGITGRDGLPKNWEETAKTRMQTIGQLAHAGQMIAEESIVLLPEKPKFPTGPVVFAFGLFAGIGALIFYADSIRD